MKTRKWPFLPMFAIGSLLALVVTVELNSPSAVQKVDCSHYTSICGVHTVTLQRLFTP